MQKLLERNTYTPTNASLVRGSVACSLNKEETLSETGLKTSDNISEENLRLPAGGHKAITPVYVLNKDGSPLMPCTPAKARHLIKDGKAKVVSCKPFTIQLKWDCERNVQPITLGVDVGYLNVGFSAVSDGRELISGEARLRKDVSKKLADRRMYRRNRRSRLWHRKPRFLNRVANKKKGWLAPSIQHKLDSHIRLVEKIKKLLPISNIIVEVANFDIQKIKNPNIHNKGYQQGEQLGFYNIREYVLHRDNHLCQYCKGKSKDKVLQIHHIRGKKEGATDRPEELMTVCKTCHEKHHKGIIAIPIKFIRTFKPETFMSTIRRKLVDRLGCQWTYGYITKNNRIELELEKSHSNDAFVIAGGNGQTRTISYSIIQVRRNNRKLQLNRKGFKPSIRRQRYKLQPNDLIKLDKLSYKVKGICSYGKRVALASRQKTIYVNVDKVKLSQYGKGLYFNQRNTYLSVA